MKPHRHAEVIKSYIDGIQCEYWREDHETWGLINRLSDFDSYKTVRIKPEPEKDTVEYYYADTCNSLHLCICENGELKLTFDGETGKLKDAEVIK
jgi:hypothetical protein